jgi:WD40 repeat protein
VSVAELDGRPVVIAGGEVADPSLRVLDLYSGQPVGEPFGGHQATVTAVAMAEFDGQPVVVSGSNDGMVCIWTTAGKALQTIRIGSQVLDVTCNRDYLLVAVTVGIVALRVCS